MDFTKNPVLLLLAGFLISASFKQLNEKYKAAILQVKSK